MAFDKIRSIKVSERVFDIVGEYLTAEKDGDYIKIDGYLETFNNCREQGYVLRVDSCDYNNKNRTTDVIYIWVYENRNSDDIVVAHQFNDYPHNGMFSDETYEKRRKYFDYGHYQEAADYIEKLITKTFEKEFTNKE